MNNKESLFFDDDIDNNKNKNFNYDLRLIISMGALHILLLDYPLIYIINIISYEFILSVKDYWKAIQLRKA
jgi:hypothetical protein